MNLKKSFLRWTVAVLAVLMLAACGSSTTSSQTSPATSPTAAGESAAQKAQTGEVTFSVQFPQADLKKALMDNGTVSIYVEWGSLTTQSIIGSTTLTPDANDQAAITVDVPVGMVGFKAIAKDSNNMEIDMTSSIGEITTGANIVYLTFLSGDWQFVDASDNLNPQIFTDAASNTTTLAGFSMKSAQVYGGPVKATIDATKPVGYSDYQLQWQSSTAAVGPLMWAGQGAQFNAPAGTGSSFGSDWLNITDPTRSDTYSGQSPPPVNGDRLVWIMDWEDNDGPSLITDDATNNDLIPQFKSFGNTQILDGNHVGGHLMAMTFNSMTQSAPIATGIDCNTFWYATPAAARAAAIKASLTKSAGKAAIGTETTLTTGTANSATVKYTECNEDYTIPQIDGDGDGDMSYEQLTYDANGNWRYDAGDTYYDWDTDGHWDYTYPQGTTYEITEVYSNIIAREFRAKGSQAGSVYTIPTVATAGAWYGTTPGGTNVVIGILDSSNYLEGEDGVADGLGGMPGMERGTYVLDTMTGNTTFNVQYETNGDWGPGFSGTPKTYLVTTAGDFMSIYDPINLSTFTLNRVPTSPTNPVLGSWYFTGGNMGTGSVILVLLSDGTYKAIQADSVNTNDRLFETGTFTWDSVTGTFVGTGVFSSNPASNVIAFPGTSDTATVTINGNTMDWFYNGVTSTASRL